MINDEEMNEIGDVEEELTNDNDCNNCIYKCTIGVILLLICCIVFLLYLLKLKWVAD